MKKPKRDKEKNTRVPPEPFSGRNFKIDEKIWRDVLEKSKEDKLPHPVEFPLND